MTGGTPTPEPAVQKAALNQLRKFGGDALIQSVVKVFLTSAPDRLKAIRAGVVANDAAKVASEAHALKSSAGQLGAAKMAELLEQAEQGGINKRLDGLGSVLAALEAEFALVHAELAPLA
jgi:HPt (histidine-containing phosphotransfer) domain-containing protein